MCGVESSETYNKYGYLSSSGSMIEDVDDYLSKRHRPQHKTIDNEISMMGPGIISGLIYPYQYC